MEVAITWLVLGTLIVFGTWAACRPSKWERSRPRQAEDEARELARQHDLAWYEELDTVDASVRIEAVGGTFGRETVVRDEN